jgi:FkbM family methyltransferase
MEFVLPCGDFGVTLEIESTGDYEPVTTSLIESILEEGMTFVDVGAHVGLFSLPAAKWIGETGHVISFEPHPDNYEMLIQNTNRNGLQDRLVAVQSAISDIEQPVELHTSPYNSGDHHLFHKKGRHTISVPCTTLDLYFPEGSNIDVIKMDVQGAEAAAFRGMRRVLQENQGIKVIWELSPSLLEDAGSSAQDLLRFLADFDFMFTIVDDTSGKVQQASMEEILSTCPYDSYLNILCERNA